MYTFTDGWYHESSETCILKPQLDTATESLECLKWETDSLKYWWSCGITGAPFTPG